MGDLARQRRSRSIHVSRGHLTAATVGVALWTLCAVAGGYIWGRHNAQTPPTIGAGTVESAGPDEALADALDRLEGISTSRALDELGPSRGDEHQLAAGPSEPEASDSLVGDPAPDGEYTLSLGQYDVQSARALQTELAQQGLAAWRAPVVTGGQVTVRLAVGGFETLEEAKAEQLRIGQALQSLGVGSVETVPLR